MEDIREVEKYEEDREEFSDSDEEFVVCYIILFSILTISGRMNHKRRFRPMLPSQPQPRPFPPSEASIHSLKSSLDDRVNMVFVRKCSREKNITLKWTCSHCRKTNLSNPMSCSYCHAPKMEHIHFDPGKSR